MFAQRMVLRTLLFLLALTPPLFPAASTTAAPAAPVLKITEYNLGPSPTGSPSMSPQDVVAGPDGNLWITEQIDNTITKMTPEGQILFHRKITTPAAQPMQIAPGPDGNMWFAEYLPVGQLGQITPAGAIQEFKVPTPTAQLWSVVTGPDNNLWFTEFFTNAADPTAKPAVGRMSRTGTGAIEFSMPFTYTTPTDITVGPDNALWFTLWGGDAIGRIPVTATSSSDITLINLPSGSSPIGIVKGPDGNIWFAESGTAKVGRINPTTMTLLPEIALPGSPKGNKTGPLELAVGPDDQVWVVEYVANIIASVSKDGTRVVEYPITTATDSHPNTITQGPDKRMYFTQERTDRKSVV